MRMILLLSASLLKLQNMLDICFECGNYLGIIFNAKSRHYLLLVWILAGCDGLQMGQDIISWSPTLKYLRVVFKSARTVVTDVDETVRKFYASANANVVMQILSHVKYASEMSKLFLVETFCLPELGLFHTGASTRREYSRQCEIALMLSYSFESLNFSRKQLSQLNVCWNNIYRTIFNIN